MERLINIDRRIIFVFIFFGTLVPLLYPTPFPIEPSKEVRSTYEEFERVAKLNDPAVLLSYSYGASTEPEIQPMVVAILRHCFANDIKVVGICLWPEASGLAQPAMEAIAAEYGKTYGEDYAFMGYKPGLQAVIINMGQNFHDAFPKDTRGTPVGEIALTSNINSLTDFDFIFDFASGDSIEYWWIPYGKREVPFAGGCTAVMAPDLYPFLQSGQLKGLLGGLVGAAEYEALIDHPESATAGMSAQSITHLIIIAFILFGNLAYFATRRGA
ncbi:MAG: hypothetical protein VX733_03605 [Candidatus Latescibacterota bacterium]|nr:hypothetical protein [Candidatus Latescibacterota bacterium]